MKISSDLNQEKSLITEKIIRNSISHKVTESKPIMKNEIISELVDENGIPTEQAYQVAVNKLNEFMDHSQKNSKFVFHKDLGRYYVEVVDARTQEVVKEIPPKELLDAYYEMQKLAGNIFDNKA